MKDRTLGDIKAEEYQERNEEFQRIRSQFKAEIENIKDEKIKLLTQECLNKAPLHFWFMPASSTGKYHAKDENENGGLILHSKRVARVAEHIMESWPNKIKKDVIRSACILHDVRRYGSGNSATKWSQSNHPKLGADFVQEVSKVLFWGKEKISIDDAVNIDLISYCIASHMGKWGQFPLGCQESLIVHLADTLATNVYMDVDNPTRG